MASNVITRWRKASASGGNGGECVELAHTGDRIRDSKNANGPALAGDVAGLLAAVKADRIG